VWKTPFIILRADNIGGTTIRMKEITVTRYAAFDGTIFETAQECREYESTEIALANRLANLSVDAVVQALSREDEALAEVLEKAGLLVRSRRRASGDLKRHVKKRPTTITFESDQPLL
jgi:hypothetical protein